MEKNHQSLWDGIRWLQSPDSTPKIAYQPNQWTGYIVSDLQHGGRPLLYSDEEPLEGEKGGGGETVTHNHRSTGTNTEGVVYASPENGELDMSMKEDESVSWK